MGWVLGPEVLWCRRCCWAAGRCSVGWSSRYRACFCDRHVCAIPRCTRFDVMPWVVRTIASVVCRSVWRPRWTLASGFSGPQKETPQGAAACGLWDQVDHGVCVPWLGWVPSRPVVALFWATRCAGQAHEKSPGRRYLPGLLLSPGLVNSPGGSSDHFFSLAIESCRALSGSSAAGAAASPGAALAPSMPAVGSVASGAPAASGMVASISMRTLSRS